MQATNYYLIAVISSQTVRHKSGETSEKHEAIIANKDQCKPFAFTRRDCPGFFFFSQSARIKNSSVGTAVILSETKRFSPQLSGVEVTKKLVLVLVDWMLFKTVNMWVFSRESLKSAA